MRNMFIPPTRQEFDTLFLESHLKGGGLHDIKVFYPPPLQRARRGGGIFSILSGLAKKAIPFLIRNVAPEAVRMGQGVLGDVLEGRKLRESLKSRGVEALKGVGKRIARGGGRIKKRRVKQRKRKTCYKNDIFNTRALV